ncbi:uncharacterized protein NPIL_125251 [Nephila pilipes]|uniref:Uncharacterized protein n=1 Tax=Nephila pilipes TaxID=299642 RepID=A0A8X6P1J3_NEPPI|nr:uncharacterized protein NPIL_125251 [Nephila pilipes]
MNSPIGHEALVCSQERERFKREFCVTMASCSSPVKSLRQMTMLKIAIAVCSDPDLKAFMKENGRVSFFFQSKENEGQLNDETGQAEQTWTLEDYFLEGDSTHSIGIRKADVIPAWETREDSQPLGKWEEVVERKISSFSFPQRLRSEMFGVIRSVTAEIDKWIKDHSLVLVDSVEIARSALCYFQWNSLGKIDRVKTAITLITNEILQIEDLNILALHFGLMDDMHSDRHRSPTRGKISEKHIDFPIGQGNIDVIWNTLTGESATVAPRNFFARPSPEQKLQYLKRLLSKEGLQCEVLLHFLSYMEDDERNFFLMHVLLKF